MDSENATNFKKETFSRFFNLMKTCAYARWPTVSKALVAYQCFIVLVMNTDKVPKRLVKKYSFLKRARR